MQDYRRKIAYLYAYEGCLLYTSLLLSALYCGGVYGGSIPAVLVGIPGTPASAPTALEGKAMVRRGKAGQALNLVTIGSCFGGFISSVALLICEMCIRDRILSI